MWVLRNIGHCSTTDMSSLGPEGSPGQAKVLPSLGKGGMHKAQLPEGTPKPERFLFPAEAEAVAGGPQPLALCNSIVLALLPPGSCPPPHTPLPSPLPFPTTSSLPLSPTVQRLLIILTPYLLISLSLCFFLFLLSIDPPDPSLSFTQTALCKQMSPRLS